MNLVERFFRDLTEFITEKSFASTRELADAIIAFLAARNENPQRYVWKAKGEGLARSAEAPSMDGRGTAAAPRGARADANAARRAPWGQSAHHAGMERRPTTDPPRRRFGFRDA